MPTLARPPQVTAAPQLDLETRLAMVDALMTDRLQQAKLAFEVDTAHPDTPTPEITGPLRLTPTLAPCPYNTPIAGLLHRARTRLENDGWCTGQLRAPDGAACLIGSLRTEASSRHQADDACMLLLEAIRRDFQDADSIPAWNDGQRDPRMPLLYLDRAAALAYTRGL